MTRNYDCCTRHFSHCAAQETPLFAGCIPCWMSPEYSVEAQVALGISPAILGSTFERLKAESIIPKAAIVVSPSYFGSWADIKGETWVLMEPTSLHLSPILVLYSVCLAYFCGIALQG